MHKTQNTYLCIPLMPYGKERRKFIIAAFNATQDATYCVNAKHRPQMKHDTDLQKLVKIGFLKQKRVHLNSTHARTYLVKV